MVDKVEMDKETFEKELEFILEKMNPERKEKKFNIKVILIGERDFLKI